MADDRASVARRRAAVPAPLLVVASIVSVQIGAATARTIFDQVGPAGATFLRLAAGAAVLLAVVRPNPRRLSRAQWVAVGAYAATFFGMNLAFYEAIARIPLGPAVTLEFLGPLAVAVAYSRRRVDLVWVALAGLGVLALTGGVRGSELTGAGVAFALVAGACWAAYIMIAGRVGRLLPGATGLALALPIAALAVLPLGVAAGGRSLLDPRVLVIGAAVGVLSSVIPYSLELAALRRMSPAVFGVLMSLEPGMAALAGLVVLGQHLAPRELAGIALVCLASAGATVAGRRPTVVDAG